MKVIDLNITQWNDYLQKFRSEHGDKDKSGNAYPAMRIENTMFTSARYAGGMTFNGGRYTYFEPVVPGEKPNPDGTPYVAWLMVRDDFLRYVTNELNRSSREARKAAKEKQKELF